MRVLLLVAFWSVVFVPAAGAAVDDGVSVETTTAPDRDPTVVGGLEASTCEFPTSVLLYDGNGLCTGTLVNPEIVLYAAHCGTAFQVVRFGESFERISREVPVEYCKRNTDRMQVGPDDYAFCKLAQRVDDVPLTPVAYGCELNALAAGADVAIAGFGADESGQAGTKRWAMTKVAGSFGDMISVGGANVSAWQGDSGGPAFVKLADGSWRAFGIVSGGSAPGQAVAYVRMDRVVRWVEDNSGVDITPCYDRDGNWTPTPDCQRFSVDPQAGGSWTTGCNVGGVSGYSATCGSGYIRDELPPKVTIMNPSSGTSYGDDPALISIEVQASDDETAVKRVWLETPGVEGWELQEAPYVFEATFGAGTYTIVAHAEDMEGNTGSSTEIELIVGDAGGGCAVQGRGDGWTLLALIGLVLGVVVRRRREL